jgi:hypothetical protein
MTPSADQDVGYRVILGEAVRMHIGTVENAKTPPGAPPSGF